MNECANRCRAFHCIWKPHIQWQLRGFGGTSEEKQEADNGSGNCRNASRCYLVEDSNVAGAICKVVERSIMFEDQEDGKQQAKITDDVDDQGFLCGSNCSTPLIPETNE